MMRKLLVEFDDELDLWLKKQVNQAETVRKAVQLYKGDIKTDTIQGLRTAFLMVSTQLDRIEDSLKANNIYKNDIKTVVEEPRIVYEGKESWR